MASFEIIGNTPLKGEIEPQGAKNEALQVIAATLLTEEEVLIENIPNIVDINNLIHLLKGLGVQVDQLGKGHYLFKAKNIDTAYFDTPEYKSVSRKIRGSIMLLAPIIARTGAAKIHMPGGDKIGRRRIDTHLAGLEKLGVSFRYIESEKRLLCQASKMSGGYILLDEASVTGTANILMGAVLAAGSTTIYNAACEPYIQQLCNMLNSMGAKIGGIGSNLLHIEGVKSLSGTKHRLLPDMIEVGSFMGLAALTASEITIKNAGVEQLGIIPLVYKQMGLQFMIDKDNIVIPAQKHYEVESYIDGSILTVSDAPWPGFTPDLISVVLVMASQAKGSVMIHQKMFESRLFFVDRLIDMGAKIILCDPHRACVIGHNREIPLKGIEMTSPDIRAGVAMLIAALSARGKSTIHNIEQIDRGYEDIDVRLTQLGAQIKRIED